uniref:Transcription factor CPC n=1 Tax=Rhizophora mucronata TaxID=61149 RepID=A0A2P2JW56_RHIMU
MDQRRRRKQAKTSSCCSEEVSSIEWEFINMSEQEEDLIYRMHKLVGDRKENPPVWSRLFRVFLFPGQKQILRRIQNRNT